MKRDEILHRAEQAISVDRAATYGNAEDNFGRIAAYWSAHLDTHITTADVAVMMTLLKLARAKVSPGHADSWIDAAGYAALGGELATHDPLAELQPEPFKPAWVGSATE